MNIVEQNRNQYTKERTDVEVYLMRIIQRFFDIKNNETQESIEAMITESLTRLKRDFYHLKTLIFHFNGETGHITIDISTVGGEFAFEKNTAFNKDFGSSADTICEGNDIRLSDDRVPTTHVHTVSDIDVFNLLTSSGVLNNDVHNHLNQDALDVIAYTGTAIQIDLAIIEKAMEDIDGFVETIKRESISVQSDKNTTLKPLQDALKLVQSNLKTAEALNLSIDNWLNEAKDNIDIDAKTLKRKLNSLLLPSEQSKYEDANKSIYLVSENIIDISDMNTFKYVRHTCTPNQNDGTTQMSYLVNLDKTIQIPQGQKIAYIKASLVYDRRLSYIGLNDDGVVASIYREVETSSPIPMYHTTTQGNEPFVLSFEYDDNGKITFSCNFFILLPSLCTELYRKGLTLIFCTQGMNTHKSIAAGLGYVASFADISKLEANERAIIYNKLNSLPIVETEYSIDGQYKEVYDMNGNLSDEGWFDTQGNKINDDDIDWEVGIYPEQPNSYLVLNRSRKVVSEYMVNTEVERNALISINPSAISGYLRNPRIKYQVYCRKE